MAQQPGRLFRFVYTSIYIVLFVILAGLMLITPGDVIERSMRNGQAYNIWILVASYVVTILTVATVFSTRLWIVKSVLAGIPKAWVPVETGDVGAAVNAVVVGGLDRSAAIAYESRPRVRQHQPHADDEKQPAAAAAAAAAMPPFARELGVSPAKQHAMWSSIEHEGWAPPTSPDFPSLQYTTVLAELPALVEAKALTLAPATASDPDGAATLLQRPVHLALRGYLDHLAGLGVLSDDAVEHVLPEFLEQYEYARFSTRPIDGARFRRLMHLLAELMNGMHPLDLSGVLDDAAGSSIMTGSSHSLRRTVSRSSSSLAPSSSTSSLRRGGGLAAPTAPSIHAASWATAPSTPRGRRTAPRTSLDSGSGASGSIAGFSRGGYDPSSSGSSTRSAAPSQTSVIRLATADDDERLPYVLNLATREA